jgi:ribosomal protein S18 acetylase RimI-like enzyme
MIRLATEKDSEHLLMLSANSFGNGFHQENYFTNIINHHRCYVYEENKVLVGFCTIIHLQGNVQIDSIVVEQQQQGKGIASRLVQEVLLDYPNDKIISYAWKQGDEANLHEIYIRLGFIKVKELPNYWHQQSLEQGYTCIVCGNPCHCTAVFYEK